VLVARRSGDKAKLRKVLKAREEEKARTMANLVRAAKGITGRDDSKWIWFITKMARPLSAHESRLSGGLRCVIKKRGRPSFC
jgi:hypothetical protein